MSELSLSRRRLVVDDEAPGPRLFDMVAGAYRIALPPARGSVFVSSGERRLATWDERAMTTWDIPSSAPGVIAVRDGVTSIDIDAQGNLAVATAVGVAIMAADGRGPIAWSPSGVVSKAVAFSADGKRLAIGRADDPGALRSTTPRPAPRSRVAHGSSA